MDVPECVRICSNPDLKAAAEIAFTRGTLHDRNEASRACLLFNKKLKRNEHTSSSSQEGEDELKKVMIFVESTLFEKF